MWITIERRRHRAHSSSWVERGGVRASISSTMAW
jgi:hypothetical protein